MLHRTPCLGHFLSFFKHCFINLSATILLTSVSYMLTLSYNYFIEHLLTMLAYISLQFSQNDTSLWSPSSSSFITYIPPPVPVHIHSVYIVHIPGWQDKKSAHSSRHEPPVFPRQINTAANDKNQLPGGRVGRLLCRGSPPGGH